MIQTALRPIAYVDEHRVDLVLFTVSEMEIIDNFITATIKHASFLLVAGSNLSYEYI